MLGGIEPDREESAPFRMRYQEWGDLVMPLDCGLQAFEAFSVQRRYVAEVRNSFDLAGSQWSSAGYE